MTEQEKKERRLYLNRQMRELEAQAVTMPRAGRENYLRSQGYDRLANEHCET